MKDKADTKTMNLLASAGARRQASYASRQKAMGRKQHAYWLTQEEAEKVAALLASLRSNGDAG